MLIELGLLVAKVGGSILLIDIILLLLLWRVKVHQRNIDRRMAAGKARTAKSREDDFWSDKGQEELYRDFDRAS